MTTVTTHQLQVEAVSDTKLRMVRAFAAPRVLVFRAFTDPDVIPGWWGRIGSTTEVDRFEFRPGGHWRFVEHSADGNDYAFRGRFLEIEPPSRLVQTFQFEGDLTRSLTEETELVEGEGVTTVTTITTFDTRAARDAMLGEGMSDGAAETYDRLEAMLPSLIAEDDASSRIVLRRFYQAPRDLVFTAWTEARHLDCWWGPDGFTTTTETIDARAGGTWRYRMTGPDGTVFPNVTWYDEVTPPERIVYRHAAGPDDEAGAFHVTVAFESYGNVTGVVADMRFPSADACRAVKAFGAVEKGYETHARLTGYLRELG